MDSPFVEPRNTPVTNDFARFVDEKNIEGRSYAEVRADLGIFTMRKGQIVLGSASWTSHNFSSAFSGVPRIVISANDTTSGILSPKVRNVTTSGFEATMGGGGLTTITCDYIAIN